MNNIKKFEKDLEDLIITGELLRYSMVYEIEREKFEEEYREILKEDFDKFKKKLPPFKEKYQEWYSESLVLLKQLLPDRVNSFIKLYEKPRTRKTIEYGNYVIEDYLQNLVVTSAYGENKVGPSAAVHQFDQQLNIVKAIKKRFESSLFDIKQLTQADIFDSELEAAKELNKKGFSRGAGAIAGVVLEKHLSQVCENHNIKSRKKHPSISDFNDILKNSSIYEVPTWRKIQHLGDIRNLCDHNKTKEPTKLDVEDLISGVESIIKTIY